MEKTAEKMSKKSSVDGQKVWDVAVIGGGPAGMMAAGRAAELLAKNEKGGKNPSSGSRVILLEKNDTLGKKLLITGGGRCNVTNAQFDVRAFLQKYNRADIQNDKFLFSAFSQFAVKEALDFFNSRGMPTKIEAEGRVFPVSNSAQSVWDVLVDHMKGKNVHVRSNASVTGLEMTDGKITAVLIGGGKNGKNGEKILAKKIIVATGGTSRPETGSTGDGFEWLAKLGHSIITPTDALVPITLSDAWVKKLSGLALRDIKLTTFQNNQKQEFVSGKILFTHVGASGPTILNMSKSIGELLDYGDVEIRIDMLPNLAHDELNARLQEIFKTDDKKKIKNALGVLIPAAIVTPVLNLAKINPDTPGNGISREERLRLIDTLKGVPLHVSGLLGSEKAVVSSGGVDLAEVDFKTMQSRLVPNLYLVGDVLNIDRPSGGYSLQLCWTTGFVAGTAVTSDLPSAPLL